ncbi:MAG TPA: glycosyltransferase family 4 protein [Gaiellaceae bacterium]
MRIAYYSPLPPERSGIADYSALLLPELDRRLDVRVVTRGRRKPPRGTDVCLYHIGNNPDVHDWIFDALEKRRGVVVLHEFVVHHLIGGLTLGRGDTEGYLTAMQREGGLVGRMLGHAVVDGFLPPLWESQAHAFPLAGTILDRADGVLAHSRYVEGLVRAAGYGGPVWRVPFPARPDPPRDASDSFAGRAPVVGCIGNLNPAKRIPQLLAAFARLRQTSPHALLVLAGAPSTALDLETEAGKHGLRLGEDVLLRGYVPEAELWSLAAACDVCVNLRWPTMGETSAAAVQVLSLGKPIVVSDVGWFSELPDEVALKIPVDELEVDVLAATLELLAGDDGLRARMSAAALEYVRTEHSLARTADLYAGALEDAAGRDAVLDAVLDEVGRAAAEVGIEASGEELSEVGALLRETRLGG